MPVDFFGRFQFSPQNRFVTVVEEDVWTVHRISGVLAPIARKVFVPGWEKRMPTLRPSLPEQMLTAVTQPQQHMHSVERALKDNDGLLQMLSHYYGLRQSRAPVPLKPYSVRMRWSPLYAAFNDFFGDGLRGAYNAGMRVRVGLGSWEEAIAAMNVLRQALPSLVALSAVSPQVFPDHSFASFRYIKYREMAGTVVPNFFRGPADFEAQALSQGFHRQPDLCWWAVRICTDGSVETRAFDVQHSQQRRLALIALTRILVAASVEGLLKGEQVSPVTIDERAVEAARGKVNGRPLVTQALGMAAKLKMTAEAAELQRL